MESLDSPLKRLKERSRQLPVLRWVLALWIFGFVLAFITPIDIIRHEWASEFVRSMESIVPMIANIPAAPHAHPIAKFFHSVMWLSMVCCASVMLLMGKIPSNPETVLGRDRSLWNAEIFFAIAVCAFFYFESFSIPLGINGSLRLRTRLGLALSQAPIIAFYLLFLFVLSTWIRNIPKIYSRKSNDDHDTL